MQTSIIIVDDHPVISHGLQSVLSKQSNFLIRGVATKGDEALKLIDSSSPDIVILDITLQGIDGISLLPRAKEISPSSKFVMYTMHNTKDYIHRALKAGATGYVLKSDKMEEVIEAIEQVTKGKVYLSTGTPDSILADLLTGNDQSQDITEKLTPREYEIASLIAQGMTPDQIADTLFISPKTVRVHRTNIMHKFSCTQIHELLLQLREFFPQ